VPFRLRHEQRANAFGKEPTVWILEDDAGNRLDVWPALGFNAFRWTASGVDLLDCDPAFFQIQKPTRSGFPILFPFPNRIRDGRYTHRGRAYQLPLNSGANAIHGFALNEPWSASATLGNDDAALTGRLEFDGNHPLWPATGTLQVECRLSANGLTVTARVETTNEALPFGLGYHPYFLVGPFGGDEAIVTVAADAMWELRESLPTGTRLPLEPNKDLRDGQPFGSLSLDDAYTNLRPKPASNGLGWVGCLAHPRSTRRLDLFVSPEFREIVAFTPPHRRSIAIEPYTCATDAINLQTNGVDAGWLELPAGKTWQAIVRLEFTP
jgi:aldose 1-epimerase